jgi:hypothetical protein
MPLNDRGISDYQLNDNSNALHDGSYLIQRTNYFSIICIRKQHSNHMEDDTFKRILQDKPAMLSF